MICPPSQNFTISTFETPLWNASSGGYPQGSRRAIERAIAEAWQWLLTEGLILPAPDQPNRFFCPTRRGSRLKSTADTEAYKKRGMLPRSNLHALLLETVRPMFIRGQYELATIEAFKQIKISVRTATSLPEGLVRVDLVREAFHETTGALTDKTAVKAERQALLSVMAEIQSATARSDSAPVRLLH
jgi:hypothetical protein